MNFGSSPGGVAWVALRRPGQPFNVAFKAGGLASAASLSTPTDPAGNMLAYVDTIDVTAPATVASLSPTIFVNGAVGTGAGLVATLSYATGVGGGGALPVRLTVQFSPPIQAVAAGSALYINAPATASLGPWNVNVSGYLY